MGYTEWRGEKAPCGLSFPSLCPDNRDIQTACLITKAGSVCILSLSLSFTLWMRAWVCVCVCFIIVSKAKQPSLSFHPPPPPFPPPSLERQFPEPRPGNFASVGWAERQRGLWEEGEEGGEGWGRLYIDTSMQLHCGVLLAANRACKDKKVFKVFKKWEMRLKKERKRTGRNKTQRVCRRECVTRNGVKGWWRDRNAEVIEWSEEEWGLKMTEEQKCRGRLTGEKHGERITVVSATHGWVKPPDPPTTHGPSTVRRDAWFDHPHHCTTTLFKLIFLHCYCICSKTYAFVLSLKRHL